MKYITLIILSSTAIIYATSLSIQEINTKVAQIQTTRGGMNIEQFETVSDPFVYFERNATTGEIIAPKGENIVAVSAIMNGKAYINGGWKRAGEKIGDYTIKSVGANFIVIRSGNKIKKLFVNRKQENNVIKIQGRWQKK
jgi:hypothetical protein